MSVDATVAQARDALRADIMSRATLEAAVEVEQELAKDGWDQPPRLWRIIRQGNAQGDLWAFVIDGKEIPGDGGDQLTFSLRVMAAALRNGIIPAPSKGDLFAWVLTHEGWMVAGAGEELNRRARKHQLHKHPQRVETRIVMAMDRSGLLLVLTRARGQGLRAHIQQGGEPFGGQVPEALREVMEATP